MWHRKRLTLPSRFFTGRQKRGIVLLAIGVTLLYVAVQVFISSHGPAASGGESLQERQTAQAHRTFADSLRRRQRQTDRQHPPSHARRSPARLTPFAFDPNTADSLTLRRLGLPHWMAGNILRYRQKGGRFRRAEDFRKIYGLTQEQFDTLFPYIVIDTALAIRPPAMQRTTPLLLANRQADSLSARPQTQKYEPGTTVDLNRADTAELKMIPGIGSGIARLISGYRQRLGGFYRIEQLEEIGLDHTRLAAWFCIDTAALQRLNVNRLGVERLRRHPYLNFYQAKAIVEYRRKHGPLKSLKPFALYEEFTPDDLERLAPYLSFE